MANKCKECNTPLQSAIEAEYGKCTACLRKGRMSTAANVVEGVTAAKPAKIKTPSRIQPIEAKGETECIPVLNSDQANSVLLSFRVSPSTEDRLNAHLQHGEMTKAAYLRAILEDALGDMPTGG